MKVRTRNKLKLAHLGLLPILALCLGLSFSKAHAGPGAELILWHQVAEGEAVTAKEVGDRLARARGARAPEEVADLQPHAQRQCVRH